MLKISIFKIWKKLLKILNFRFNFDDYDVRQISVYVNEQMVPNNTSLTFKKNDNVFRLHMSNMRALGMNSDFGFNPEDVSNGYFIGCFDLTPEGRAYLPYYSRTNHGCVRLRLDFGRPLPETAVLFTMFETNNLLKIDQHRNPELIEM